MGSESLAGPFPVLPVACSEPSINHPPLAPLQRSCNNPLQLRRLDFCERRKRERVLEALLCVQPGESGLGKLSGVEVVKDTARPKGHLGRQARAATKSHWKEGFQKDGRSY